jgi:hypothetical protein
MCMRIKVKVSTCHVLLLFPTSGLLYRALSMFCIISMNIPVIIIYRALAKKGPWAVHLTLYLNWGVGRYSRYQCRSYTRKSAQVSYPRDLHNSNCSHGYYWYQPYSSTATNREWRRLVISLGAKGRAPRLAGYRADTSPFGSHIKWAWLRSLAETG